MPQNTENVWNVEVIKAVAPLPMDSGMVAEVKEGLEFGQLVNLPSNIAFSSQLLSNLFVSDQCVRPFQQLR